jgi:hypothetical protein
MLLRKGSGINEDYANQFDFSCIDHLCQEINRLRLLLMAIAANNNITAQKRLFVYFNLTLGFSRVVYSTNLLEGGPFSVLANFTSRTNIADQANFSLADFTLV